MSVNDPDPGGITFGRCATPSGENCIPIEDPDNPGEPVRVTGVSSDGSTIGISANVPFVQKLNTRIVFGTVERTLTLTGTNADDNTLAAAIGDSDAGGVVSVEKTGSGKWVLAGNNTYTGDTFIDDGVLSVVSPFFDPNSSIELTSGGMLDLNYGGENVVAGLVFDGIEQADGRWGGIGNVLADFTSSFLSGTGLLNVGNVPAAAASAAVPEPSLAALVAGAFLGIVNCRRR